MATVNGHVGQNDTFKAHESAKRNVYKLERDVYVCKHTVADVRCAVRQGDWGRGATPACEDAVCMMYHILEHAKISMVATSQS